ELADLIASSRYLLPVGGQTKPALLSEKGATLVSLARLSGMVEYEPSEFTFTALAGTPIRDVRAALAERKQYLPFDPYLVEAGATLGGTVATGISGPGRVRYGGLRDFLLGVRFFSGEATLIRAGGKVVKNAAGFDIPKLMVGSLGRLGVMTELTFKVFPQAADYQTLVTVCDDHATALKRIRQAGNSRWELEAIEYQPGNRQLSVRLGGPSAAMEAIATEISQQWGSQLRRLDHDEAATHWANLGELNWAGSASSLVRIPTSGERLLALQNNLESWPGVQLHWSAGGAALWFSSANDDPLAELNALLDRMDLEGLVIRGSAPSPRLGPSPWLGPSPRLGRSRPAKMIDSIKNAIDPHSKFPALGQPRGVSAGGSER
ncbi:MAG: FAD-binding protein, partial [Pirellulales bacterium]|nr:FAD-binding protein [Pirellulales bacterium]